MTNKKIIALSFLNALGTAVYVAGVAFVLQNGQRIFGKADNFFGPTAILMLLVVSASITGTLVLGRPILLYLENLKTEAVKMFFLHSRLAFCYYAIDILNANYQIS
jgi:uncharacterized protein (UPF0371 family)